MKFLKRTSAFLLAVIFLFSAFTCAYAAEWNESWESIKQGDCPISLTPGADSSSMNFSWQTKLFAKTDFEISQSPDMSGSEKIEPQKKISILFHQINRVTAEDLEPATSYYYRYSDGAEMSEVFTFSTADSGEVQIMFCSDPQIGRSGDEKLDEVLSRDTLGWTRTVDEAFDKFPGIDMVMCAGDLAETAYTQLQYKAVLSPAELRSVPMAAAIGNHDFYMPNYSWHFNNPNSDVFELFRSPAGNGYYYCINNTLFIVLNSNNFNPIDQCRIMSTAVKEYPDAQFRVAMFHHSPFTPRTDESTLSRYVFPKLCDKFDIDVALTGHDHIYSRSHFIEGLEIIENSQNEAGEYVSPQGTVYFTANSASGSNFSSAGDNITEYCAAYNQNRIPQYSIISISQGRFEIATYSVGSYEPVDEAFVIIK